MSEHLNQRQKMIRMIVAIVDRGKGKKVVDIFLRHHIHLHLTCLGMGTANSEILDYFGLGETEKDVVVSLAPKGGMPKLLQTVTKEMQLKRPGKGILFTIPLSGLSLGLSRLLSDGEEGEEGYGDREEVSEVEETVRHDLILTVINQGYKEVVMAAAREAGASGGTVIHGRNVGTEGAEKFFGISIQPEKDIIAIIVSREDKAAIMKAVSHVAGMHTACQGFIFSLPVDSLAGLE